MATTRNFLTSTDSLVRFPVNSAINQTPEYLNNNGAPLYNWTFSNASGVVVANIVKLPSCNSLLVVPSSTADVFIRLNSVTVDGTVRAERNPVSYLFHCLVLSQEPAYVLSKLTAAGYDATPRDTRITRDQFTAIRSNVVTFDPDQDLPSASYLGSDPDMDIELQISNHGGYPFYLTFPALVDVDAWKYNAFVSSSLRYIPTMYRDIDEAQEPEYPYFRLIDALSYRMGEAAQIQSNWFRFEPNELPSDANETDTWTRSQLTDPYISPKDSLEWSSNIIGRPLFKETYAINPTTGLVQSWQDYSYPLEMTTLLNADLATVSNVSVSTDLVVVAKWSPVRSATTGSINLSNALIDGVLVGGVTVATGDRVLVKHQSNPAQNGIYIVASSGAATRATDADSAGEFSDGKAVLVTEGTLSGTYWAAQVPTSLTLGSSSIEFAQTLSPGVIDGVDIVDGANVLLLNQNDPAENGLYVISSITGAARHPQMNQSSELLDGLYIEVSNGSRFTNTLWRLFAETPMILGVDPLRIFYVDRRLDFLRSQVATAMYGHRAGSFSSIRDAARRFLVGSRSVVVDSNIPNQFYITVRTLLDETVGIDAVDTWSGCRVATTEDVDLTTEVDSGKVIDGIVLAAGDRILVWNQTALSENGIYVVQASGPAVRATDANNVSEFSTNKSVYVELGIINGDTYFTVSTLPTTIDVSNIEFTLTSNLGSSDIILKSLEPARPVGYVFEHKTLHKFTFTLDSPSLGRFGSGTLG